MNQPANLRELLERDGIVTVDPVDGANGLIIRADFMGIEIGLPTDGDWDDLTGSRAQLLDELEDHVSKLVTAVNAILPKD